MNRAKIIQGFCPQQLLSAFSHFMFLAVSETTETEEDEAVVAVPPPPPPPANPPPAPPAARASRVKPPPLTECRPPPRPCCCCCCWEAAAMADSRLKKNIDFIMNEFNFTNNKHKQVSRKTLKLFLFRIKAPSKVETKKCN